MACIRLSVAVLTCLLSRAAVRLSWLVEGRLELVSVACNGPLWLSRLVIVQRLVVIFMSLL